MVKNLVQVAQPRFQRAYLTRYCGPALFYGGKYVRVWEGQIIHALDLGTAWLKIFRRLRQHTEVS
ncbi:MAG: hypothetical protein WBZ39_02080 [Methylovirgula sp.]